MHIGQLIEQKFRESGHTATWFASKLCCTRANVYKTFSKENIDVHLLMRISRILHYDFFVEISQEEIQDVNNSDTEVSTHR
jgi:hypothetical protein